MAHRAYEQAFALMIENERIDYAMNACPDEGFFGELIRALSDRLARLVTPGDVGVVP